jgi:small subunit ribosomal protein S20
MPHIPVHPSAAKRHRQNLKRQERSRSIRTRARSAAKRALDAISGGDEAAAREQLREAVSVLSKAASAGTLHRNTARRKVARLSAQLSRKFAKPSAPAQQ